MLLLVCPSLMTQSKRRSTSMYERRECKEPEDNRFPGSKGGTYFKEQCNYMEL